MEVEAPGRPEEEPPGQDGPQGLLTVGRILVVGSNLERHIEETIPKILLETKASDVWTGMYRCQGCGRSNQVAVMGYSPRIAKHICCHCRRVNEVKTRESSMDALNEDNRLAIDIERTSRKVTLS